MIFKYLYTSIKNSELIQYALLVVPSVLLVISPYCNGQQFFDWACIGVGSFCLISFCSFVWYEALTTRKVLNES